MAATGGGSFDHIAAVSLAIQNYQGTPESIAGASFSASANPNPPSVTPSWGAQRQLALAVAAQANVAAVNSFPTNYSLAVSVSRSSNLKIDVGSFINSNSPEDPGTFTLASAQTGWAETILIRN